MEPNSIERPFQHRHQPSPIIPATTTQHSTTPSPPPPVPPRPTIRMPSPQPTGLALNQALLNHPRTNQSQLPQLPPSSPHSNPISPHSTTPQTIAKTETITHRRTSIAKLQSKPPTTIATSPPPPPPPPPRPRPRSHTTSNNHRPQLFSTPQHPSSPPTPPPKPPKPNKLSQPTPSLHFNARSPNIPDRVPHPAGPREWTPNNLNSPTHRSANSRDSHNFNTYFSPPPPSTPSSSKLPPPPPPPPHSALSDRPAISTRKRISIPTPLGIGFPSSSLKPRSTPIYDSDDEDDFEPETASNPDRTRSSNLPYGSFPPPPPPPQSSSNRQLSRALSGSWLESPLKMDGKQLAYIPSTGRTHEPLGRVEDMPDPTFANRRPPSLNPPVSISVGSQFSSWALRGNWLCTGHHQFRLWHAGTGECLSQVNSIQDIKITCMEFKATASSSKSNSPDNRFVWCGTKDGQLFEFDCAERRIVDSRASLHSTPIVGLFRCKEGGMCSIDESAKVQIWASPTNTSVTTTTTNNNNNNIPTSSASASSSSSSSVKISGSARTQRIADKTNFVKMISHRLWTASGPSGSKTASVSAQRGPTIRVYDPDPSQAWTVTPRPITIPEAVIGGVMVGMVTAGAVVPSRPELIYLGHESGHVSVWETRRPSPPPKPVTPVTSTSEFAKLSRIKSEQLDHEPIKFRKLIKLSNYQITAMEGVTKYLWVGFRTGNVYVYEPEIQKNLRSTSALNDDNHHHHHHNGQNLHHHQPPHLPARRTSFHNLNSSPLGSWKVLKVWRAHKEAVLKIIVDPSLLWDEVGKLHVATTSTDWKVKLWDGTMSVDWLASEMRKRQTEYCTYRPIKALICSWNVDACKPNDLSGTCDNLNFLEDVLKSSLGPEKPDSAPLDSSSSAPKNGPKTLKFPLNSRRPGTVPPPTTHPPPSSSSPGSAPDLIVFGFQEMIDLENKKLTAKTVLLGGRKKAAGSGGGGNSEKLSDSVSQVYRKWHDKLVAAVRTFMPPDDPYVVIHTENLVGLFTCVFVKSSERAKMRDIAVTTVKTGMKGRYGNKGAIIARLVIDDSSICFINCHLAAGQKHVRQRNSDLIDILEEKSAFPDPPERAFPANPRNNNNNEEGFGGVGGGNQKQMEMIEMSNEVYVGGGNGTSISDHEICFLQGDLNYRIDAQREEVIRAIAAGEYWKLLEFDQLIKEKKFNPSCRLRAFFEPPIRFHPTYKYDPGTHMYDSSEKNRVPAWCDRILYRTPIPESQTTSSSPPTIYIQQDPTTCTTSSTLPSSIPTVPTHTPIHHPSSHPLTPLNTSQIINSDKIVETLDYRRYEVNISDHRPVSATFAIQVKSIVPGLKRRVRDHALEKFFAYVDGVVAHSRSYYSEF